MKKQKLIIVSPRQYGYQTDYLKYTEYLPEYFDVDFLCLDQGEKYFYNSNINLIYTKIRNKKIAYIFFFIRVLFYLSTNKGIVMTTNFKGCSYLKKLLPWKRIIVNIRTVSVDKDVNKSKLQNAKILSDAKWFDRIIMISKGGAEQLKLPMDKVHVVSLGADVISEREKNFDTLRLLYVGTLTNRDIIKTVKGFHQYLLRTNDLNSTYDIVGDGDEYASIQEYVTSNKLQKRIFLHGRKSYDELRPFFDKCNVGISFVPITSMYDYQPPTKTFEYINSGLFCIATDTKANHAVITSENGLLINDSDNAFCESLLKVNVFRSQFSSVRIKELGVPYLWKNIIERELLPALRF